MAFSKSSRCTTLPFTTRPWVPTLSNAVIAHTAPRGCLPPSPCSALYFPLSPHRCKIIYKLVLFPFVAYFPTAWMWAFVKGRVFVLVTDASQPPGRVIGTWWRLHTHWLCMWVKSDYAKIWAVIILNNYYWAFTMYLAVYMCHFIQCSQNMSEAGVAVITKLEMGKLKVRNVKVNCCRSHRPYD